MIAEEEDDAEEVLENLDAEVDITDGKFALPLLWAVDDNVGDVTMIGVMVGLIDVWESVEKGILLANRDVESAVVDISEKVAGGGTKEKELI